MNKLLVLSTSLLLFLAACAPSTQGVSTNPEANIAPESPAAQEVERVATAAFHRMELVKLEEGVYTANVLINLDVPQGVRWVLAEPTTEDSYTLRFTSTNVPGVAWIVTPEGVEPRRVEEGAPS